MERLLRKLCAAGLVTGKKFKPTGHRIPVLPPQLWVVCIPSRIREELWLQQKKTVLHSVVDAPGTVRMQNPAESVPDSSSAPGHTKFKAAR
jgi:hypothetical protein